MKRTRNKYISIFALIAVAIFSFSCTDDRADELTSIDYERLFSPIDVSALVINRVDSRIDWAPNEEVESYTLEVFANDNLTFAGTPVRVIEDVKASQIPYTISELEGEVAFICPLTDIAICATI